MEGIFSKNRSMIIHHAFISAKIVAAHISGYSRFGIKRILRAVCYLTALLKAYQLSGTGVWEGQRCWSIALEDVMGKILRNSGTATHAIRAAIQ